MTEMIILGSGAGFATHDRFSTSIAVCHDESIYVFDCGEPCSALMFREGLTTLAVRGIFVSHMHADHVGGLAPLLFSMYLPGRSPDGPRFRPWSVSPNEPWYADAIAFPEGPVQTVDGRYPDVALHVPAEAVGPVADFLPAVYLAPEVLPFDLAIRGISTGVIHDDGTIRVTALANTHLSANAAYRELPALYPHMALESYSFAFEVAGTKVVYSGDITAPDELSPLLHDVDVVVVEMAHFDPSDLEDAVLDTPASRIVLTHIHPGLESRVVEIVRAWNDPRVSIAHDGMRIGL